MQVIKDSPSIHYTMLLGVLRHPMFVIMLVLGLAVQMPAVPR